MNEKQHLPMAVDAIPSVDWFLCCRAKVQVSLGPESHPTKQTTENSSARCIFHKNRALSRGAIGPQDR